MEGFCPLASGSKGNCIYLGTKKVRILIDAGLSARAIASKLSSIGVELSSIDAILVTHEHIDHIRGLQILGCRMGIPVFANSETAKAIYAAFHECPQFKIFSTGESFVFEDLEVHPFSIQHDAVDPVAFTIRTDERKLGFCTDLGFATTQVISQLQGCDYLCVEANHEPAMVHASARPAIYKQRVLSRQGHLSNQQCADLIKEIQHQDLKHIYLAHLSSECNAPEVALKAITNVLAHNTSVAIAYQAEVSNPILFDN